MKKWISIILAIVVLIIVGLFFGLKQVANNPSVLLNSKVADEIITTVIKKADIDMESIDVEAIKEAEINKEVVNEVLAEYGLSGMINVENLTDADLEALRDKVVEWLESGAAFPTDIDISTEFK